RMSFHDVNQDGLADLVILIPYEKIKILIAGAHDSVVPPGKDAVGAHDSVVHPDFEEQDVAPPGGTIEQPWMSVADVDGDGKPELLLAQRNFLRAVVLKPDSESKD